MSDLYEERRLRFTFGLQKLGLVALRVPGLSLVMILIASAMAIFGVMQLRVDDSLSELFRTDSEEFRKYEAIDQRFPSSEHDVLAVVEGKTLLSHEGLMTFSNAAIDLQLADGVKGLVSMLSARSKPDSMGYAAPIVPDELPESDAALQEIISDLRKNEVVKGNFLSDDGRLALIVMSLDRQIIAEQGLRAVISRIQREAEAAFKDSGLKVKLTGAPVMQLEIRNAVERDRLVYNGLGFILGALIAFAFFRSLSLMMLAVLGPCIAILWTLGVIGSLDFRLNLFINVLTPLILVAGFSDSMHLVFAIRRDILAGKDRLVAARNAVREVAPASLLTAMNAALALLSFALAESALIRTFGLAAIIAVGVSYLAVAIVVPTLAVFLIRREAASQPIKEPEDEDNNAMRFLKQVTEAIVRKVIAAPTYWFVSGLIAVMVSGFIYVQLEPRYRLADQVPDKEQALEATAQLDQKLTGANPVHIMIEWTSDADIYDAKTLSVIAEAHKVLEDKAGLGNVWSLESLRRWLAEAGDDSAAIMQSYVRILPSHLQSRFIAQDRKAVLVTGRLPDINASEILPKVEKIDKALQSIRDKNPDFEISVTGLSAIAARNSAKLISELNWGLIGDMFIIFIFLGLALRSALASFASVLPSLFPIFATGTVLWFFGSGLQFASIIAITVAFALAIDSTIHFLNRYNIEEARIGPRGSYHESLIASIHYIGPAIVLTTIVLALGLGVTVLSDLPSLRLFGLLTAVCLFASLIGQLVILPATIAFYRRIWPLHAKNTLIYKEETI